jgi:hypothetical protein
MVYLLIPQAVHVLSAVQVLGVVSKTLGQCVLVKYISIGQGGSDIPVYLQQYNLLWLTCLDLTHVPASTSLPDDLRATYAAIEKYSDPAYTDGLKLDSTGLWRMANGQIWVPDDTAVHSAILHECHDADVAGHPGRTVSWKLCYAISGGLQLLDLTHQRDYYST